LNAPFLHRDRLQRLDTVTPLQAEDTFFDECWYPDDPDAMPKEVAASSMAATAAMAVGLRPLPEVAQRVLDVTSRPDADLDLLCVLIESDPALASKIIRLANSAYLRRKTECRTLRQAVQRLGFKMLRGLALSVATLDTFSDPWGEARRIREHCAGAAAIARVLTAEFDPKISSEVFLATLLHDFGKLLVHQTGELDYERFRQETRSGALEPHVVERRTLGYDHAVLGGWILKQWEIPRPIPRAVAMHHRPDAPFADDGPLGRVIAWVMIADELDHHIECGAAADEAYFDWYARRPAFVRVGLGSKAMDRLWRAFVMERQAMVQVFSGR
jgi:HD-like signal output (HDOD) protein